MEKILFFDKGNGFKQVAEVKKDSVLGFDVLPKEGQTITLLEIDYKVYNIHFNYDQKTIIIDLI